MSQHQFASWRSMAASGLSALVLSACVSPAGIAPQLKPLPAPAVAPAAQNSFPSERWWAAFGDKQLDELVDAALQDNPSLAAAAMRLQRARILIDAADAAYGPSVTLSANPTQQRFAEHHLIPAPVAGSVRSNNRLGLDFSGEIDFWGKQRAALDGAIAQEKLAAADLQVARLSIASSLVRSWVELDRLTRQRNLLAQQLAVREQTLALQRLREKAGFEPGVERMQSEAAMASMRGELRTLEARSLLQRHLVAVLAGRDPASGEKLAAPSLQIDKAGLPASLSAEVLARRPDVALSRWRVEAATQDAAVTKAGFYPNVNLVGFVGFQSLGFDKWLDFGSRTYSVGPAISLPIFDAGRLRASYGMKTTDIDAAVAQYNQTLLDAMRDIVDTLSQLDSADRQQVELQTAYDKAREVESLLAQREKKGLINHLPVLSASAQRLVAERNLADLAAFRFDTRIQLIRAIGGDGAAALPALLTAANKKDPS